MIIDFIYLNVYFNPGPGRLIDHYIITDYVITLGRKRTYELGFWTCSLKQTVRKNWFAGK